MTAAEHIEPPPSTPPPYLVGDRVQILYMSKRGTILADAHVSAVLPREDGRYGGQRRHVRRPRQLRPGPRR